MGADTSDGTVTWRCRALNVIQTRQDLRSILQAGMVLYFCAWGTPPGAGWYAHILSITADRIFIAGGHLFTTNDIGYCYYSNQKISLVPLYVNGEYGDGTDSALLANDMKQPYQWRGKTAKLVGVLYKHETDAGTTQPYINILKNSTSVLMNAAYDGVQPSTSWQMNGHPTDIDVGRYTFGYDDNVEIECTVAGTGSQASDLSVILMFVETVLPAIIE
jgi:hypothetical protein